MKNGQFDWESLLVLTIAIVTFIFIINSYNSSLQQETPEQKVEREKQLRFELHDSEQRYCQIYNQNYSTHYYLNDCLFVECENNTGRGTYQICNSRDKNGNFGSGLLVGWILFAMK